jgi:hypothetical protein
MQLKHATYILISALSLLLAPDASAGPVWISAKYPTFAEIDGEKAGGSANPMIAAHLMGATGMANPLDPAEVLAIKNKAKDPFAQTQMANDCLLNSNGSSWPGSCSPQGVVMATTMRFQGFSQKWVLASFSATKQALALSNQVSAMNDYKSPIVVPWLGHVDHWITIRRMNVILDVFPKVVQDIEYYDAGDGNFADLQGTPYKTGLLNATGDNYKLLYYKIIDDVIVDATDINVNKYIFSYDPPTGTRLPAQPTPYIFARGVPMVDDGEMTEDLAPLMVWDALDAQGLLSNPAYAALHDATPGAAWTVHGKRPGGAPWDYIVVPMHTEDMRALIGLVALDASDGAYEMLHLYGRPQTLDLPEGFEARRRATSLLGPGELLGHGALTWDPACGASHCEDPLLPYSEFTVRSRSGTDRGRIIVPMGGRRASRR